MSDTVEQLRKDLDNVCAGYRSVKEKLALAESQLSKARADVIEEAAKAVAQTECGYVAQRFQERAIANVRALSHQSNRKEGR